jgi:hypothetical protein
MAANTTATNPIGANLAAVEAHFHSQGQGEVEQAVDLYTDDVVWDSPARGLVFQSREATAANYRRRPGTDRPTRAHAGAPAFGG